MAAAGSHRVMHFARELQALDWEVSVISSTDFRRNRIDPVLLDRIPSSVRIRRVFSTDVVELIARIRADMRNRNKSGEGNDKTESTDRAGAPSHGASSPGIGNGHVGFFDYLTRLMKTPDSMLSFVPCAVTRAIPEMMGPRPDVLFSSAPPYSCHLTALCLKSLFHVPWIADFRDPWSQNPFRENRRYPSLSALNSYLESYVVQQADLVLCNTHALEDAFRERYPNLDHFVTLTNGFDPQLLERFAKGSRTDDGGTGDMKDAGGKSISLVHTGEVYGLRSPHAMIDAFGELQGKGKQPAAFFNVSFYGNVDEQESLEEHAGALGVREALQYHGQVDHEQALKRCAEADMLLLLGVAGNKPEVQVPSKVFEYLAMKKPILSLSKQGGAIHRILEESGAPYLLADLDNAEDIRRLLERAAGNDFDGGNDWESIGTFSFDRLAARLARYMTGLKKGCAIEE